MEEEGEYEEKSFSSYDDSKKKQLFPNLDFEQKVSSRPISDIRESIYSSRESISNRESLKLIDSDRKANKKTVSADFDKIQLSEKREKKGRYMSEDIVPLTFDVNEADLVQKRSFVKKISMRGDSVSYTHLTLPTICSV